MVRFLDGLTGRGANKMDVVGIANKMAKDRIISQKLGWKFKPYKNPNLLEKTFTNFKTLIFIPSAYNLVKQLGIKMINVPGKSFRIMENCINVRSFRYVMRGYVFEGTNFGRLQSIFRLSSGKNILDNISLLDAREYVERINKKTYGNFRIPYEDEWKAAKQLVRRQLSGHDWEWTETISTFDNRERILGCLNNSCRPHINLEGRYPTYGVRLVDDLPVRQAGK